MTEKLFGTDGIRGLANHYPLTANMGVQIGQAVGRFFKKPSAGSGILIGRDTRLSGTMIESALAAGICSVGMDAHIAGIVPTPAIAYLTRSSALAGGVVISASHNPWMDNGIKLFQADGFKLSPASEKAIERHIAEGQPIMDAHMPRHTGQVQPFDCAADKYVRFLCRCRPEDLSLSGRVIAIDCANGAAFQVAPRLFSQLEAVAHVLADAPDGVNINVNCGSQHPERLSQTVLKTGADIGLALDGDADRLIAVDETGRAITGDQIMMICAAYMLAIGRMQPDQPVVTTVMSNLGLKQALAGMGLANLRTAVGDRNVMQAMVKHSAVLGGEDSGHILFLDQHTSGDGLLTALNLLAAMQHSQKPLSELAAAMPVYPQVLINIAVDEKPPLDSIGAIQAAKDDVLKKLGDKGRVLVRYSGTQNLCRVMVEGPDEALTKSYGEQIADAVRCRIGGRE